MDEPERRARLIELVESIADMGEGAVILVEGIRDVDALRRMGVRGRIAVVNQGRTIVETVERLAEEFRRVVVLTDWDRSGGSIARSVKRVLEGTLTEVDLSTRRELAFVAGSEARTVEGLPALLAKALEDKAAVDIVRRRKEFARLDARKRSG